MQFPEVRGRRLRRNDGLRRMVRENHVRSDDFVYPMFVVPGKGIKKEIASMPGQFQMSVDMATEMALEANDLGVPSVILFGIPKSKDEVGKSAWDGNGVVQKAIRSIKEARESIVVCADACFCEYTSPVSYTHLTLPTICSV